jgi:hypothetical protein
MEVISPLSFVFASLIVYWTGWNTDSWLLGVQIIMFILYLVFRNAAPQSVPFAQQIRSSLWLVVYYLVMLFLSYLGTFQGIGILPTPYDQIIVALVSIIIYYWGVNSGLSEPLFYDDDEVEKG